MMVPKSLITNKRTHTSTYVLPFLFKDKNIFCNEYGFINAFAADINRPWLENHIFVLFKYDINKIDAIDTELMNHECFYDKKNIMIDKMLYTEYMFIVNNPTINIILNGEVSSLSFDSKQKIVLFWNLYFDINYNDVRDLFNNPLHSREEKLKDTEVIPEVDEFRNVNTELVMNYIQKWATKKQPIFCI